MESIFQIKFSSNGLVEIRVQLNLFINFVYTICCTPIHIRIFLYNKCTLSGIGNSKFQIQIKNVIYAQFPSSQVKIVNGKSV